MLTACASILVVLALPRKALPPSPGPEDLLRSLYVAHQPWRQRDALAPESLPKFFDEEMVRLFGRQRECEERTHEPGPLDWDPVLTGQDFGDDGIGGLEIRFDGNVASAEYEVSFMLFPKISKDRVTVRYFLVRSVVGWRVHDISYGKGKSTLREILSQPCQ